MERNVDYDIINALAAKSHLQWRYDQYIEDAASEGDEKTRQIFERLKAQDAEHIEALKQRLRQHVQEGSFN